MKLICQHFIYITFFVIIPFLFYFKFSDTDYFSIIFSLISCISFLFFPTNALFLLLPQFLLLSVVFYSAVSTESFSLNFYSSFLQQFFLILLALHVKLLSYYCVVAFFASSLFLKIFSASCVMPILVSFHTLKRITSKFSSNSFVAHPHMSSSTKFSSNHFTFEGL